MYFPAISDGHNNNEDLLHQKQFMETNRVSICSNVQIFYKSFSQIC